MLYQPTSSPITTTMLGCFALVACACRVALPPAKTLETASAPSVSFRALAPKSILFLFHVMPVNSREGALCFVYQFTPVANGWELSHATGEGSRAGLRRPNDLTLSVRFPDTQPPISLDDAKKEGCGQTKQQPSIQRF